MPSIFASHKRTCWEIFSFFEQLPEDGLTRTQDIRKGSDDVSFKPADRKTMYLGRTENYATTNQARMTEPLTLSASFATSMAHAVSAEPPP